MNDDVPTPPTVSTSAQGPAAIRQRGIVLEVIAGTLFLSALIMAVVGYFFGLSLYNAATDQAELTILLDAECESSLLVMIRSPQGMEYVIRPIMKNTITVPTGKYSLTLMGKKPGSQARLDVHKIELKRGRSEVVRIRSNTEPGP